MAMLPRELSPTSFPVIRRERKIIENTDFDMKKTDYAHREALAAPKRKTNASRRGEADTCRIMHKMLECYMFLKKTA